MAITPPAVRKSTTGMPQIRVVTETAAFNKFLSRFMRNLKGKQGAVALLKIGLDLTGAIISKNPVRTGRSRAAWFFAADQIAKHLGTSFPSRATGPGAAGGYTKGGYRSKLTGLNKFIEIQNAVEYIWPLEFGHSAQAPHGMVRISMMLARRGMPKHIASMLRKMWKGDGRSQFSPWRASSGGPVSY